jgi:hypothetical protein
MLFETLFESVTVTLTVNGLPVTVVGVPAIAPVVCPIARPFVRPVTDYE